MTLHEEAAAWEATRRWLRAWAEDRLTAEPAREAARAAAERAGVLPDEAHKARKRSQAVRFQQIADDLVQGPDEAPDPREVSLDAAKATPTKRAAKHARKRKGRSVYEHRPVPGGGAGGLPEPLPPTAGRK